MKKIILLLSLLAGSFAFAQQAYNYPYQNADVASLTTAIMKSKYKEPSDHFKSMEVEVIPGRDKTYLVEGRGDFKFYFYPQKQDAPLIFLIADFGGNSTTGYMMYEASLLHQNGFNVITISSSLFWNFIISSSNTGIPGLTSEDAQDMYVAMQLSLQKVKETHKRNITKIGVMGLGLGGLHAAHISAIESRERKLNIEKYLLVNPVVNMIDSVTQIETRAAIALDMGIKRAEALGARAFNFVVDMSDDKFKVDDPTYFLNLDKKFVATEQQYKFLSGFALRTYIGDTVFSSQLINDMGVLKEKFDRYHRNARNAEAFNLGFQGYLKQIFAPYFSKKYRPLELLKHVNFNYVRQDIIDNQNIILMHNEDDFTVSSDNLNYLKELFGNRAIIYPLGGHLGNLWHPQNQQDVLNVFSSLK